MAAVSVKRSITQQLYDVNTQSIESSIGIVQLTSFQEHAMYSVKLLSVIHLNIPIPDLSKQPTSAHSAKTKYIILETQAVCITAEYSG